MALAAAVSGPGPPGTRFAPRGRMVLAILVRQGRARSLSAWRALDRGHADTTDPILAELAELKNAVSAINSRLDAIEQQRRVLWVSVFFCAKARRFPGISTCSCRLPTRFGIVSDY